MIILRKSKFGFWIAGVFVALALWALFSHLYSVKINPGDSGESGIALLPFSAPWILMVPRSILGTEFWGRYMYAIYLFFVAINAFILYAVVGGVMLRK